MNECFLVTFVCWSVTCGSDVMPSLDWNRAGGDACARRLSMKLELKLTLEPARRQSSRKLRDQVADAIVPPQPGRRSQASSQHPISPTKPPLILPKKPSITPNHLPHNPNPIKSYPQTPTLKSNPSAPAATNPPHSQHIPSNTQHHTQAVIPPINAPYHKQHNTAPTLRA